MQTLSVTAPVSASVLAHLSTDEKAALRHLAAERGATLSRTVRLLIQQAIADSQASKRKARK